MEDSNLIHLYMEADLPYLLLYRYNNNEPDPIIQKILRNEASYCLSPIEKTDQLKTKLSAVVEKMTNKFGAFLIVEIFSSGQIHSNSVAGFTIHGPEEKISATINTFKKEIENRKFNELKGTVNIAPAGAHWWSVKELQQLGCLLISLEIETFYRDKTTQEIYPLVARSLISQISIIIKKGVFQFVKTQTKHRAVNFLSLSSRKVPEITWQIDKALKNIDDKFEFLPLITPINSRQAYQEFKQRNYRQVPQFHYRMLPMDPELVKRELYNLPLEKIDDPTLAYLFRDKRIELDNMLTMLNERGTKKFLWSSVQLYGGISIELLDEAKNILSQDCKKQDINNSFFDAQTFAAAVRDEFLYFKNQQKEIEPKVEIKDTVNSLMVSKGKMLISTNLQIPENQVKPLIQHEIGTHVLTYLTGTNQPLKILGSGVPGYEELQEGLAVFAEYLAGGLTLHRLRTLAERVIAVDSLIRDYDFIKTYNLLTDQYKTSSAKAFQITMRVYRGGGLSKDMVYLKGLMNLVNYLKAGNDLEILLCGKIREDYVPIIEELIARGIANPLTLKPRYLQEEESLNRLKSIHQIKNLLQLTN